MYMNQVKVFLYVSCFVALFKFHTLPNVPFRCSVLHQHVQLHRPQAESSGT